MLKKIILFLCFLCICNGSNRFEHFPVQPRIPDITFELIPADHTENKLSYFEGDIVGVKLKAKTFNNISKVVFLDKIWNNGVVPYTVSKFDNDSELDLIYKVLRYVSSVSCVRFRSKQSKDEDYVDIVKSQNIECYSSIGRVGGRQILSLGSNCRYKFKSILHVVMHVLGFWHEHSRPDRDSHVSILWRNISPGLEDNFAKYYTGRHIGPYDVSSIMHLGPRVFSKSGKDTIRSLTGITLAESQKSSLLSSWDIEKLNALYQCEWIRGFHNGGRSFWHKTQFFFISIATFYSFIFK